MRTIVDLTDAQLAALAEVCEREGISRAEAVRRAVDQYLREEVGTSPAGDAFGRWADRDLDALAYEDEVRGPRTPPGGRRR